MTAQKVYTKIGDKGSTFLADGQKVKKTSLRIETYGSVDELNAFVGLFKDQLAAYQNIETVKSIFTDCIPNIQNELFIIGSELSGFVVRNEQKDCLFTEASVSRLEKEMDEFSKLLPPLKDFVLPGGHLCNSSAHIVRTVCRRVERLVLRMDDTEPVRSEIKIYFNRLSDWFFVVSRLLSLLLGSPEIKWEKSRVLS